MRALTKTLLNYFLIGTLAVIPIAIILKIIIFVKNLVSDTFKSVYGYADSYLYTILFFTVSFAILASIGRTIVEKGRPKVITLFDQIIDRIPFLNTIYRVLKKVIAMFTSSNQEIAKEIVYVEYPKSGSWMAAYVTNRFEDKYVVFVPTSPNPTSGFTIIVDKDKVIPSSMDIEEVTSLIVSVGVDFAQVSEIKKLP
jgi:uncharacterized membrane protein